MLELFPATSNVLCAFLIGMMDKGRLDGQYIPIGDNIQDSSATSEDLMRTCWGTKTHSFFKSLVGIGSSYMYRPSLYKAILKGTFVSTMVDEHSQLHYTMKDAS